MKKLLICLCLLMALVLMVVACNQEDEPAGETQQTIAATEAPAADTQAPAVDTQAPVVDTQAPAVEATEAPATEAPATEAPATDVPATEAPATEEPATEAPATEEPATEEPATEEPVDPNAPVYVIGPEMLSYVEMKDHHDVLKTDGTCAVESKDGYVTITPFGGDPYYYPDYYFEGARYISIKYRTPNADGSIMQVYLDSYSEGPKDDTTMLEGILTGDGEWHLLIIDTQPLIDSGAFDGSFLAHLRFDPLESGYVYDENGEPVYDEDSKTFPRQPLPEGATIDVAYIAFFNSVDAANIYEYGEGNA